MSQYYFLVSSLPYLLPGIDPVMNSEEFLGNCESNMQSGNFRILKSCLLNPDINCDADVSHPLLTRWNSRETSLRNELVKLRASAMKRDGEMFIREGGNEAGLFEAAREAVNISDPGEAEIRLDDIRWKYLDELESGHFFDLEKLLVYYLKLQILERRQSFTLEKGDEAYRKVYQSVVEQIQA